MALGCFGSSCKVVFSFPCPDGTISSSSILLAQSLQHCPHSQNCSATDLFYQGSSQTLREWLNVAITRTLHQGEESLLELTRQICSFLQVPQSFNGTGLGLPFLFSLVGGPLPSVGAGVIGHWLGHLSCTQADQDSIPGKPYGPLRPPGMISEHHQVYPKNEPKEFQKLYWDQPGHGSMKRPKDAMLLRPSGAGDTQITPVMLEPKLGMC